MTLDQMLVAVAVGGAAVTLIVKLVRSARSAGGCCGAKTPPADGCAACARRESGETCDEGGDPTAIQDK